MKTSLSHSLAAADRAAMIALRAATASRKGQLQGVAARGPFDAVMDQVAAPAGVSFKEAVIGGLAGWWCQPPNSRPDSAVLHLHGGWFNWGSAKAFRHLVGHIAAAAGVDAFVPDYRRAPEHPFPAAPDDALACYEGLCGLGFTKLAVTGDSAGGNLALGLLARLAAHPSPGRRTPVGAVLLSPVTDLSLASESWSTRADADPYFQRAQALALVAAYLGGRDPTDALASPIHGSLAGLPPLSVHVGDDEVLLNDSTRLFDRAVAAGVDTELHLWAGMPHGFLGAVGRMAAADQALQLIGAFLAQQFGREDIPGDRI